MMTKEFFPVAQSSRSSADISFQGGTQGGDFGGDAALVMQPPAQPVKKSRRGPRSKSSQYRGVTFYRRTGRWESHIWDCGKQVYLGGFDTAHAAARAYDRAAVKFRGLEADINFIISDYEEDLKQMANLSKEEVVQVLRRQCSGFSRNNSRYQGVALQKIGRWGAQMQQFNGNMSYDKAATKWNGREVASLIEPHASRMIPEAANAKLDLSLGISLSLGDSPKQKDKALRLHHPPNSMMENHMAAATCDTPFNMLKRSSYHLINRHVHPSAFFSPMVPVKSILDDPYEDWSAGLDFQWIDETEDLVVDNMVRLIHEGFVFRKEMFKGGLNALDLSRLRGEKKLKEKEPKDKNDKDHVVEGYECDGSSEFHDMIRSLENRIYKALDSKLEKLVPPTSQSQHLLQSTISRCLQDLDKKIGDSISLQLKDMQAAIINGVIDAIGAPRSTVDVLAAKPTHSIPATVTEPTEPPMNDFTIPSEAADCRINDVLHDLNVAGGPASLGSDASLPATTTGGPSDGFDASLPATTAGGPASLDHEGPNADDSTPMDLTEQQLEEQQNKQADDVHPTVNQEAVSEEVDMDEQNKQAADVDPTVNQDAVSEEVDMGEEDAPVSKGHEEEAVEQRKSKRAKVAPVVLQDYKCDPKVTPGLSIIPDIDKRFELMEQRLLNESIVILNTGYSVTPAEFCDIGHRKTILTSGVVNALIGVVSRGPASSPKVGIYDTTLPVSLMNHHSRFVKTAFKDRVKLKFNNVPLESPIPKAPERIYFPFNIDRTHWVGVCLDLKANTLHVLDCNTSLRSDSLLKEELTPIANLIPYVLKHLGYTEGNAALKPFTVSRCKGIPQSSTHTDAAVMIVLFIEAHAVDGLGGCKAITPRMFPDAAKQLAVKLFDDLSV